MTSEMDWGPDGFKYVHDWRRYAGDRIRAVWDTLTPEQQEAIRLDLQEIADAEEWD